MDKKNEIFSPCMVAAVVRGIIFASVRLILRLHINLMCGPDDRKCGEFMSAFSLAAEKQFHTFSSRAERHQVASSPES